MVRLDLRVQLLGRLLRRASIARMDADAIARAQRTDIGHNPLTDLLLGGLARNITTRDGHVAGGAGAVPIRSYRFSRRPDRPLIVYFHGGGWVLGRLGGSDWLCSHVAAATDAVVVSVDYRLAPAHRWPAAAEDCYAALVAIAARAAEFGADATRLAVMGDSAGGNLAAVVALLARERSGPSLAYQALLYPATDLTLSGPSVAANADAPILTRRDMIAFRDHYLGEQDPRDPSASPLFAADHAGLPPALVQVAEHDPLLDDGLRYAAALRAAGVPVRATTYVGMPHGFFSFPHLCRCVPQALEELCAELRAALAPSPPTP